MEKPFVKTGLLGLAVILVSVVLMFIFPGKSGRMPDGFTVPIIAFEFMQTRDEVESLFGAPGSGERKELAAAMDLGNYLDFGYMVLYSLFLLLFSLQAARESGARYLNAGAVIALAVLAGDVLENLQLLGITAGLGSGDYLNELLLLQKFTWLKWGGLALAFGLLSGFFFRKGIFGKVIGGIGLASLALGAAAFIQRSVVTTIFTSAVSLMFLLMIIFCFVYKRKSAA